MAQETKHPHESRVLWVLWLSYGALYFCRSNLSAAVPGLEHDVHLSKTEIGWILGSFKLIYGIGQLINGQLAERLAARRLLAIGMFGSAIVTVVFGFSTGFYLLLFLWAVNGYAQSLGWSPTMRVASNWFPPTRRGRAIAIIGTGYQLLGSVTIVIAGWSAQWLGWRGALFVPAGLLVGSALHMWLTLREEPESGAVVRPQGVAGESAWQQNLIATLSNARLWLLAASLGLLNAVRYGFLDWGVAHLMEVQKAGIGASALKNSVLPAGGIAGTLVAGWATDRFFSGRRIPVMFAMLITLGLVVTAYDSIIRTSVPASVVTLTFVGALIFGPQVLLVGTTPSDMAKRGTAAAACGFVNFFGYLGAAAGDQVTGHLVDRYDWHAALWFWAACAFAGALVVVPLWATRPDHAGE